MSSRSLVGPLAALAVAVAGYLLIVSGRLPGATGLVGLLALMVLTPVARSLPGRLSVTGGCLLGWVPLSWTFAWPFHVNHGAALIACWAGALTGAAVLHGRRRRWLPTVGVSDSLLLAAALLAAWVMAPWWRAGSPRGAVEVLLAAWDNSAHFGMFASARAHGAVTSALGASPDGSPWSFVTYPQGFHALVATLSEVTAPRLTSGPSLLASYTEMTSVTIGLGTVLLTSTLLCLPGLRSRPFIAVPAAAFVWAAYLWEPGQRLIADGFANFWYAAAAAASSVLLALSCRRHSVGGSAAIAGFLVAVTQAWTPLILFAAPTAAAVWAVRDRRCPDRVTRSRWTVLVPWAFLGLVVACTVGPLLIDVPVSTVVDATGAVHGTSPLPLFLMIVVGPYVFVSFGAWLRLLRRAEPDPVVVAKVARLSWLPAVAVLCLAAFMVAQLVRSGTTSYYFLKLLMGTELLMAPVVAGGVAILVSLGTVPSRRRWRALAVGSCATLAASQAFGLVGGRPSPVLGTDPLVPVSAPYSRTGIAHGLLAACRGPGGAGGFHRAYVPIGPGGTPQLELADHWFHSLTLSNSVREQAASQLLGHATPTVAGVLPAVRAVLEDRPDLIVVVDPRYVHALRSRLASPELAQRVRGWS